jgi:hypothetical protein
VVAGCVRSAEKASRQYVVVTSSGYGAEAVECERDYQITAVARSQVERVVCIVFCGVKLTLGDLHT